ncbi:MAG: TonB-dependent receptor [Bacteroidota bacterium]
MHRSAALLLLVASGVAASGALAPARGQDAPGVPAWQDSLETVSVSAARVAVAPQEAPARATILSAESAREAGATSVAEWLGARAPLHVRRYGPAGLATVTMRGASASQTLVLLDGQPLTDPQLGQLDLSLLPTALLGGAEVLHGGGAHLYGSGAVGGVVSLASPEAGPLALSTGVGAWGERTLGATAHASGWTPAGRWRAMVSAEAEGADDDYGVVDVSRLDRPTVRRAGWDRQRRAGVARLSLEGDAGRVGLTVWGVDAERGLGGTDSVGARQWDRIGRLALTAGTRRGPLALSTSAALQSGRLRYASPFDLATETANGSAAIDDTGRTRVATADLRADLAARGWTLTAIASGARGTGDHPSLAADATDDRASLALSAAPEAGRLRLYPALRLDHHRPAGGAPQTALTPRLGANLRIASGLHLKASAGTAFRMPTLNDRFWRPGGNPSLRPERSVSADLGIAWARGGVHAEGTAFVSGARDQIVWRPLAGGVWSPINLTRTQTVGLEASARGSRLIGRRALVELGAVGTVTDARDRSDPASGAYGQQLRLVPRWTASAWGGLELARVARGTSLRLDLGVQAVGRRTTTDSGSLSLPAYAVASGQVRLWREVSGARAALGLVVDNLLGARYEVVPTYVMPPRHLRGTLTLTL